MLLVQHPKKKKDVLTSSAVSCQRLRLSSSVAVHLLVYVSCLMTLFWRLKTFWCRRRQTSNCGLGFFEKRFSCATNSRGYMCAPCFSWNVLSNFLWIHYSSLSPKHEFGTALIAFSPSFRWCSPGLRLLTWTSAWTRGRSLPAWRWWTQTNQKEPC